MAGDCRWYQRVVKQAKISSELGQSTVEYVLVLSVVIVLIVACIALIQVFQDGRLMHHIVQSASHHVQNGSIDSYADVFLY